MKSIFQGKEVRNSTETQYAIFYEGKELKTDKTGNINSAGGIVLSAILPTGQIIKWRSNDNYGKKGFSFDDMNNDNYASENIHSATEDGEINKISPELRAKLEYKIK